MPRRIAQESAVLQSEPGIHGSDGAAAGLGGTVFLKYAVHQGRLASLTTQRHAGALSGKRNSRCEGCPLIEKARLYSRLHDKAVQHGRRVRRCALNHTQAIVRLKKLVYGTPRPPEIHVIAVQIAAEDGFIPLRVAGIGVFAPTPAKPPRIATPLLS